MRILSLVSLMSLLMPLAVSASSSVHFSDVPSDAWYQTYVTQASELGIVSGYSDANGMATGKFGPSDSVTIGQALKIAVNASGLMVKSASQGEDWMKQYIDTAVGGGFSFFADTTLDFNRPATRGEITAIIVDAFKPSRPYDSLLEDAFTDVGVNDDYADSINILLEGGIIRGDAHYCMNIKNGCPKTTFRPYSPINRAEVVKIVMAARAKYGTPGTDRSFSFSSASSAPSKIVAVDLPYSDNGFSPSTLTIKQGTAVSFVNNSAGSMVVESDPHPTHTSYPPMNEQDSTAPDGVYQFIFNQKGTYHFHNHLHPSHTGTIVVE